MQTFFKLFLLISLSFCVYSIKVKDPSLLKYFTLTEDMPEDGCAFFYEDCGFQGKQLQVCGDIINLDLFDFGNKISSFKLGPNIAIKLYKDKGYKGTVLSLLYSLKCLVNGEWDSFNDKINSVQILKFDD
jgi:hypothetical protein